jgi:hypothetical protein
MSEELFRPGNREKGWNDPPELLHNNQEITSSSSTQDSVKRTILNRRVSHTIESLRQKPDEADSNSTLTTATTLTKPPTMPPPINHDGAINPPVVKPVEDINNKIEEISIENIEKILNDNVQKCRDNNLTVSMTMLYRNSYFDSKYHFFNLKPFRPNHVKILINESKYLLRIGLN